MLVQLNNLTRPLIPFLALISFVALIVACCCNRAHIKAFLSTINKRTWLVLAAIFFLALAMRLVIPSKEHIMYIDEAWYMEAAKNMLETGSQGAYPKSIGWPFVLVAAFAFFGVNNWVAIYTSLVFGALTVISIFLMTFAITRRKDFALMAAFFISFFPAHIRWSAAAETNVVSLFFITLAIFFSFLYYRVLKRSLLWLAIVAIAFTCQFRPENYMLPFLFLAGCVIFEPNFFKKKHFLPLLPWVLFVLLVGADFIQAFRGFYAFNWVESATRGKLSGSNLGVDNLYYNSFHFSRYFINGYFQPVILGFFILIGAIRMFARNRREWIFLALWFCALYVIYFSYCFLILGAIGVIHKARFFMMFYPVTLIFACFGIDWVKGWFRGAHMQKIALAVVLVVLTVAFIPYSWQASRWYADSAQLLETKIPELIKKDLPCDCIIIANWPTVLRSTTDFDIVDIKDFLDDEQLQRDILSSGRKALFFKDILCYFTGWDLEKCRCQRMDAEFLMKPFLSYREKETKFTFYEIIGMPNREKVGSCVANNFNGN
ncbi:MAG: glycosyltransferase family 39 protein [Candidatus Omnitrophota bacterium]